MASLATLLLGIIIAKVTYVLGYYYDYKFDHDLLVILYVYFIGFILKVIPFYILLILICRYFLRKKTNNVVLFFTAFLLYFLYGVIVIGNDFAHLSIITKYPNYGLKKWFEFEHRDLYFTISSFIISFLLVEICRRYSKNNRELTTKSG